MPYAPSCSACCSAYILPTVTFISSAACHLATSVAPRLRRGVALGILSHASQLHFACRDSVIAEGGGFADPHMKGEAEERAENPYARVMYQHPNPSSRRADSRQVGKALGGGGGNIEIVYLGGSILLWICARMGVCCDMALCSRHPGDQLVLYS